MNILRLIAAASILLIAGCSSSDTNGTKTSMVQSMMKAIVPNPLVGAFHAEETNSMGPYKNIEFDLGDKVHGTYQNALTAPAPIKFTGSYKLIRKAHGDRFGLWSLQLMTLGESKITKPTKEQMFYFLDGHHDLKLGRLQPGLNGQRTYETMLHD